MPTYNGPAVSDAVIGFRKPITLQQGRALRDNPIAIAEDEPGAPKIKVRHAVSGTTATAQTFTGLDEYSGVGFSLYGFNSSTSDTTVNFAFSTNGGATFSANFAIGSIDDGATVSISGSFDFASGSLRTVGATSQQTVIRTSQTATGSSLAVNAIRFSGGGGGTGGIVVQITPNGGTL